MTTTNLLAKYLGLYKKNPKGLVFAPLAESYRKLGMLEDATKILKQGLRFHPHYPLALLVLANCFYDQQNFEEAYKILKPLAEQYFDNLKLQKLFAQICYKKYLYQEALLAYKNVLFLHTTDEEALQRVQELEVEERNFYSYLNYEPQVPNEKSQHEPTSVSQDPDAWQDLTTSHSSSMEPDHHQAEGLDFTDELWMMKSWTQSENELSDSEPHTSATNDVAMHVSATSKASDHEPQPNLAENEILEIAQNIGRQSSYMENMESFNNIDPNEEIPIVTHTLIDLYCAQKHFQKAMDLLQKVIAHNPDDERSKEKLLKLQKDILGHQLNESHSQTLPSQSISKNAARLSASHSNASQLNSAPAKSSNWDQGKYQIIAQRYQEFLSQLKSKQAV